MDNLPNIDIVMRVKLPKAPPMETPEWNDYLEAIFKDKPEGYEVDWANDSGREWVVDSEGYTLVRLYLTDKKVALEYWMEKALSLNKAMKSLKERLRGLI